MSIASVRNKIFWICKSILKQMQCRIWFNKINQKTTSDRFWTSVSHLYLKLQIHLSTFLMVCWHELKYICVVCATFHDATFKQLLYCCPIKHYCNLGIPLFLKLCSKPRTLHWSAYSFYAGISVYAGQCQRWRRKYNIFVYLYDVYVLKLFTLMYSGCLYIVLVVDFKISLFNTQSTMDRQCIWGHWIYWMDIYGSNGLDKGPRAMEVIHSYPSPSASGNDDDDEYSIY